MVSSGSHGSRSSVFIAGLTLLAVAVLRWPLAAVVLAFCLMPLLALFPDTPIALLRDGPRLQHMLPNALVGMLGALPTLVPLSLLLALVFNRALNAPAIDARLRRMNFDV